MESRTGRGCFNSLHSLRWNSSLSLRYLLLLRSKLKYKINNFFADILEHCNKQIKTILLIFNQRVFLSVCAEVNTFLKVIHFAQMLLPFIIDDRKHCISFNLRD